MNTGTESITQTPLKTGSEHRNRIKITDETVIQWDFLNFVLSSNPLTLSYKGEPFISFSESLQLLHKTAMMFNFSIFLCGNCFDDVGRIIDHHCLKFPLITISHIDNQLFKCFRGDNMESPHYPLQHCQIFVFVPSQEMDFQIGIHRGLFVCLIVVHRSSETLTNQLNPMIDF